MYPSGWATCTGLFQNNEAKKILIEVVFDPKEPDDSKAAAHYKLGSIAFAESRSEVALAEWQTLQRDYPDQALTLGIAEKINLISDVYGKSADTALDNAIAKSCISNGDFYSSDKSEKNYYRHQLDS